MLSEKFTTKKLIKNEDYHNNMHVLKFQDSQSECFYVYFWFISDEYKLLGTQHYYLLEIELQNKIRRQEFMYETFSF